MIRTLLLSICILCSFLQAIPLVASNDKKLAKKEKKSHADVAAIRPTKETPQEEKERNPLVQACLLHAGARNNSHKEGSNHVQKVSVQPSLQSATYLKLWQSTGCYTYARANASDRREIDEREAELYNGDY